MLEHVPEWLGAALHNVRAGHSKLAALKLGSESLVGAGGMVLTSAAFENGEELDPSFTADEEDAVAPPLEWNHIPAGAQELVLIVEDPDAPSPEPFCHWLVWGLAPQRGKLMEGEVPPKVGKNSYQNSEWLLPDPPTGHGAHDYVFQLFALDTMIDLKPGAGRGALMKAMEGHVLSLAILTATYERGGTDIDDWDDIDLDDDDD